MSVTPTGKRRHRLQKGRGWFGQDVLVLQIEVSGYESQYCGGYIDHVQVKYYRDARVEDLTMEEVTNG